MQPEQAAENFYYLVLLSKTFLRLEKKTLTATSTTSAPASAQANMAATPAPAVS